MVNASGDELPYLDRNQLKRALLMCVYSATDETLVAEFGWTRADLEAHARALRSDRCGIDAD